MSMQKLVHHNAVFRALEEYGNLMGFSRLPISSAVHVGWVCSVSATPTIAAFSIRDD
jgi:hypothetical protein